MRSLLNDLRYAVRALRHTPSFTIPVVATLALGIGSNTAIFSVINTVIFQPLPYPDSNRLVSVGAGLDEGGISEPIFSFWEQNNPGFEDLAGYHAGAHMNLNDRGRAELAETVTASRNYFRLFGANLVLGRTFSAAEDSPGGARVLVISYGLWQGRFGGSPAVIGRTLLLGGVPYTVVGVLSPEFQPYPPADVWVPLQADPNSTNYAGVLTVVGRLPSGATLAQANAWMPALRERWAESRSRLFYRPAIRFSFLREQITGAARPRLLILLGAVGLVLLIACVNVANLLLSRATARQREIAIRIAMGAGRGRITRQLLTESVVLAFAGGSVGLMLGSWGVRALLAFSPGDLPRVREIAAVPALDPQTAGFTLALAVLTGVLFGLAPAFHLSHMPLAAALSQSGARTGTSSGQSRIRGWLVVAEVALAVVLLCGAILLIRSFAALHSVNPGFEPGNLLAMEISLAGPAYSKSSTVARIAGQFVERAERIPGVQSAALASALPLFGKMDMIFDIPGRAPQPGRRFSGDVQWRFVSSHYFATLRIPLISGRLLRDQEPGRTVVISQAMARTFWPGANPIGQSIFIGHALGPAYQVGLTEIVGVAGDVRERLEFEPGPIMYQTPSQIPDADMALLNAYEPAAVLVRTRPGIAPMTVSQAVQNALRAVAQLPAAKVRTMDRVALDSTARQNFNSLLLSLFAAMALLLAAVGIYGVMSYSVERRTQEIGIRAALGASPRDTVGLLLVQAWRMTLAGLGIGVAASFGLMRLLSAQLFGVGPSDPLTFAAVPVILLAVALSAACIPAWRATRIDPLAALRHE